MISSRTELPRREEERGRTARRRRRRNLIAKTSRGRRKNLIKIRVSTLARFFFLSSSVCFPWTAILSRAGLSARPPSGSKLTPTKRTPTKRWWLKKRCVSLSLTACGEYHKSWGLGGVLAGQEVSVLMPAHTTLAQQSVSLYTDPSLSASTSRGVAY